VVNFFDFTQLDPGTGVFAQLGGMGQKLADLVGKAESEDRRVSVSYTASEGLTGLTIDPRAMRGGSQELAEMILDAVRKAKKDLESQSRTVMRDLFGEDAAETADVMRDPQAIKDRMDAMQATFESTLEQSSALVERLRRDLGQ
jgi:DNA-binding protein YbaB